MKKWIKKESACQNYGDFLKITTGRTLEDFYNDSERYYVIDKMHLVADILKEAAKTKQLVTIVGDYDVDGIGSLAIMSILSSVMQLNYSLIAPKRKTEGYGISQKILERIPENSILITVDNGIVAVEQISEAKKKGIYTIILDHHEKGEILPDADIIIDPAALGEADCKVYCGAGLAYKLAESILGENDPRMSLISVIAMLSTIGDSVPLIEDNRKIVIRGLQNIRNGIMTEGLKQLIEKSGISLDKIDEGKVGFNINPCLNAPARLEDNGAIKSIQLLLCTNPDIAATLADELIAINTKRKDMVSKVMEEVEAENLSENNKYIMIYKPDLEEGIVGIISGKLSEKYGLPSITICETEDGMLKGSCRSSAEEINLKSVLDECSDILLKYGGHQKAAAFSMKKENLKGLKEKLSKLFPEKKTEDALYYDFDIMAEEIPSVISQQYALKPFGEGNRIPLVCIRNIKIGNNYNEKYLLMGKAGNPDSEKTNIKLKFKTFNAIGFGLADVWDDECEKSQYFDLLGYVEQNEWNGRYYNQIRLVDFRPSSRN